ncbi:MAG TPA: uridine kinase, partial [Pseudonocardiaceae bacterium]
MRELADLVLAAPARLGAVRLVAVEGPSGSGKSTVADTLAQDLAERGVCARVVRTDHFATWTDPVGWWPRFVDGVLTPLARGESGRYQRQDWSSGVPRPGSWVEVEVPEVLIFEGVSSGRRAVRPALSVLVWVEVSPPEVRLDLSVARDGEPARADFVRWQAFERGWFAVDDPKAEADVLIENRKYSVPV